MMRSEDFSLSFFENISKFMILKKTLKRSEVSASFIKVGINVQKTKTELKFAKTQKF